MKKTERLIASKDYILREIAGESVLVSVGDSVADFCGIVTLNSSARVLWEALQEPITKEALAEVLSETFSLPREKALEDVEKAAALLLERGMVRNVE